MARKSMKRTRRARQQRGGASAAYTFGPAVAAGAPYASEVIAQEACGAAARPGYLAAPTGSGGLPGFAGGGLRRLARRNRRATRRSQRGGRYTFDMAAVTSGPNPFVPVSRIGCEGGMVNTAPAGAAPNPVPASQTGGQVGPLRIAGRTMARALGRGAKEVATEVAGRTASELYARAAPRSPLATPIGIYNRGAPLSPLAGGAGVALTGSGVSGAVDTMAYYAPTAGYGNTPSSWVSSAGVPSLLQTPYEASAMNPACLKTGGRRKAVRKGRKASRKGRKASRKGRKASRKGRKASRK